MNVVKWLGCGAIAITVAASGCNGDDDDDTTSGARGGTGGNAGRGGSSGVGVGGTSSGRGGTAGSAGSGGRAGSAGRANAGESGSAGANENGGAGGEAGIAVLNDSQILDVVITANEGEATEGQLAVDRASASTVQSFAQTMVDEHTAGAVAAKALAVSSGLGRESNSVSTALKHDLSDAMADLQAAGTEAFDEVYMDAQVKAHEHVLDLLNTELLVQADNGELVSLLTLTRTTVETHLDAAKSVRDGL